MTETLQIADDASVDWLAKEFVSYERFPITAVADAWQKDEAEDSTEKIFRDAGGFPAWLSYFLTKKATLKATSFTGKSTVGRQLDELDEKSAEDRASVARKINSKILADEVTEDRATKYYDKILQKLQTPRKRHRE